MKKEKTLTLQDCVHITVEKYKRLLSVLNNKDYHRIRSILSDNKLQYLRGCIYCELFGNEFIKKDSCSRCPVYKEMSTICMNQFDFLPIMKMLSINEEGINYLRLHLAKKGESIRLKESIKSRIKFHKELLKGTGYDK